MWVPLKQGVRQAGERNVWDSDERCELSLGCSQENSLWRFVLGDSGVGLSRVIVRGPGLVSHHFSSHQNSLRALEQGFLSELTEGKL